MNESQTAAAVTAYIAALNAQDADAVAACVTDDFHNEHTSAIAISGHGRAIYRERLDGFLSTFVDLTYEVEDLLVDGDRAAMFYRMSFLTRADDGELRPVVIRGVFKFIVRGGLIAHRIDYWDALDYRRQLAGPGS